MGDAEVDEGYARRHRHTTAEHVLASVHVYFSASPDSKSTAERSSIAQSYRARSRTSSLHGPQSDNTGRTGQGRERPVKDRSQTGRRRNSSASGAGSAGGTQGQCKRLATKPQRITQEKF